MNILTSRCLIRDFTADDINSFMDYRNNADWMRYQGFKCQTKETYEAQLLTNVRMDNGMQFAIINSATKQLLGDIYLKKEDRTFWLGYTIHPSYARQGYASEVVTAVIGWARKQDGLFIKAGVVPENTASVNLLLKCGFTYENVELDEHIYSLIL